MAARQVFIIWTHPLCYESVRLLLNHPDVEIVGAAEDYLTAQNEIDQLRPDTIVVEETGSEANLEPLAILKSSHWVTRVIGFSLADNKLSVYRREQKTAARAEDLLRLVRST
jgi:DNA-binding NarL/FixJ family response regulator